MKCYYNTNSNCVLEFRIGFEVEMKSTNMFRV